MAPRRRSDAEEAGATDQHAAAEGMSVEQRAFARTARDPPRGGERQDPRARVDALQARGRHRRQRVAPCVVGGDRSPTPRP